MEHELSLARLLTPGKGLRVRIETPEGEALAGIRGRMKSRASEARGYEEGKEIPL